MMNTVQIFWEPIKDFFFGSKCFYCGEQLFGDENRICNKCWQSLIPVFPEDFTYQVMLKRFHDEGIIDAFIPLFYFEKGKVLQSLAHSLKYEEMTSFGKELGCKIGLELKRLHITADAIIPVPLNKQKERERGFNQSEFIAEGLSLITGIPILNNVVKRVKYTTSQTQLNAEDRKINVANAFAFNSKYVKLVREKILVIVDDIITTGSTIHEVGKILKTFGARRIIAVSAGLAKLGEDS